MTLRRLVTLILVPLLLLQSVRAHAEECSPVVVSEACKRNLEALERANRKLDQADGRLQGERDAHADTRDALARSHEEIGRMKAEREAMWSPWVWVGIGAGSTLGAVLLVALLTR